MRFKSFINEAKKWKLEDIQKLPQSAFEEISDDITYAIRNYPITKAGFYIYGSQLWYVDEKMKPELVKNIEVYVQWKNFQWKFREFGIEEIPKNILQKVSGTKLAKNGKPIIFYHGSDYKFEKFDKKHMDQGLHGSNNYPGFYFSEEKNHANIFSGHSGYLYSCVIYSKNPFVEQSKKHKQMLKDEWDKLGKTNKYASIMDAIISLGFDSIIRKIKREYIAELIVWNPEQIFIFKSEKELEY